jgi:hypothetical protein
LEVSRRGGPGDPDTAADQPALAILREIAKRADDEGIVRLHSSEIPFFLTTEGTEWLEQQSLDDDGYRITDRGRQVLGLPRRGCQ